MGVVAQCIESAGTRADLQLLNQFENHVKEEDFKRVFKNCKFGVSFHSLN